MVRKEDLLNPDRQKSFGNIELATKWLRILSLGDIDKIRDHLVANPIVRESTMFRKIDNRFNYAKTTNHTKSKYILYLSVIFLILKKGNLFHTQDKFTRKS